MKLLSLFDGEGGFPLAAVRNGIEPVAASEIEPYPIAITRSRFPRMKHLGDIAFVNGADIEPVDIATFGSPCQSMSIAGKREGLKHESQGDEETTRSGMFFEAIRIITEMREATNGQYPRFAVWENVPGAFSSGRGRDFLAVLQAIAAIAEPAVSIPEPERDSKTDNLIWFSAGSIVGNGWSIAWRTLDAQYWGVPQRRKRIYLVADFGSERAADLLLERYSLRRNIAESGETRERTAEDATGRTDGSLRVFNESGQGYWMPGFGCLRAEGENRPSRPSNCIVGGCGINDAIGFSNRGCESGDYTETLRAEPHGAFPMVAQKVSTVFAFDSLSSNSMKSANPNSGCREVDVAKCIDTTFPDPSKNQGGVCVVQPCAAFMGGQGAKSGSIAYNENVSPTLKSALSGGNTVPTLVAFNQNADGEVRVSEDTAFALSTNGNATGRNSPVIALQANGIDRADTAGCNGAGWREDQSYTLNTVDRHAVCYQENIGSICARDYKGVGSQYVEESKLILEKATYPDVCGKLAASGAGSSRTAGQGNETDFCVVSKSESNRRFIVRRLMPIETTRLQGYPDTWHELAPFDGDVDFWESVRKTWARINGTTYKPFKDVARLEKWYYGLRNDGAEYKVDGNSLAMPCAEYVIRRIAETVREEEKLSAEERI